MQGNHLVNDHCWFGGWFSATRSNGSNNSHSFHWFPEFVLPSRILRYFRFRMLSLTRHCRALLEYPPSAIPSLILSHTGFLLCMLLNSCCMSSLHRAIKSLFFSNPTCPPFCSITHRCYFKQLQEGCLK